MGSRHVLAERVESDGVALSHQARVYGMTVVATASAGLVTLRDGGGSGTIRGQFATAAAAETVAIPFEGYLDFGSDVHVTLSNVTEITLLWSG